MKCILNEKLQVDLWYLKTSSIELQYWKRICICIVIDYMLKVKVTGGVSGRHIFILVSELYNYFSKKVL